MKGTLAVHRSPRCTRYLEAVAPAVPGTAVTGSAVCRLHGALAGGQKAAVAPRTAGDAQLELVGIRRPGFGPTLGLNFFQTVRARSPATAMSSQPALSHTSTAQLVLNVCPCFRPRPCGRRRLQAFGKPLRPYARACRSSFSDPRNTGTGLPLRLTRRGSTSLRNLARGTSQTVTM